MTTTIVRATPTDAEIREALEARRDHPRDDNARDQAWIAYLSERIQVAVERAFREDGSRLNAELADVLTAAELVALDTLGLKPGDLNIDQEQLLEHVAVEIADKMFAAALSRLEAHR